MRFMCTPIIHNYINLFIWILDKQLFKTFYNYKRICPIVKKKIWVFFFFFFFFFFLFVLYFISSALIILPICEELTFKLFIFAHSDSLLLLQLLKCNSNFSGCVFNHSIILALSSFVILLGLPVFFFLSNIFNPKLLNPLIISPTFFLSNFNFSHICFTELP